MAFVHLRTHTEYSVVDGTLRVADAVRAARDDAQVALAITDLGNLFGAVKFYKACRAEGIKPIIGVDLWIEPAAGSGDKQASRLLLLVCNAAGYHNLCDLLSRAWTSNVQRAQAWVKWQWLAECAEGLIALSGADAGAVGAALLAGDRERAIDAGAAVGRAVPGALLHRAAARGAADARGPRARRGGVGRRVEAAGGGHAAGAVCNAR